MDQPLISVIVPIYNTEKYLERCVQSILKQTYTNLEIILVDDGSRDRCGIMCDEYEGQDKRIKVIHQKNAGQSAARNAAMKIASGEYLTFVDSDDYCDLELLEYLYGLLKKHEAQISLCGVRHIGFPYIKDRTIEKTKAPYICNGREAVKNILLGKNGFSAGACRTLFHKDIIVGQVFEEGYIYEDLEFGVKAAWQAHRVCVGKERKYNYCYHTGNSSSAKTTKKKCDLEFVCKKIEGFLKAEAPELLPELAQRYVSNSLYLLKMIPFQEKDDFKTIRMEILKVPCSYSLLSKTDQALLLALKCGRLSFNLCKVLLDFYKGLIC